MPFDDVQNGLYNFMVKTLGFTNENNFQFIQPGVALPANTADAAVWSFMNEIPLLKGHRRVAWCKSMMAFRGRMPGLPR